ncbi:MULTISPECIES: DUF3750 domain-containing protein [Halomonadaceae]|uniref:DUF3750 domain-containing protein n=1 Tax=Halomonadaceae TaxID=28256 RepID=UPI00159805DA|nr:MULTISPECIES: DUF3750 domain-containing protein [Halomonas]QJQ96861.1 DUF3750 domain-containing protein [Halomonas sp. PA5]
MRHPLRWLGGALLMLSLLLAGPFWLLATEQVALDRHWSSADRSSAGLAPEAHRDAPAVVQVYAARAFHWRGAFAVHTWIATKAAGESDYRLHHVLSWRRPTVVSGIDNPDRAWFGNPPELLADYRGEAAERLIPLIEAAVGDYPDPDQYRAWPGPNSNSFVAWIIREVPGLEVTLPVTAIGKDYLFDGVMATAPSGTGYQLAMGGLFGITLAREEGLEITLLGLSLGIDFLRPALKLPGIGRIGMPAPIKGER